MLLGCEGLGVFLVVYNNQPPKPRWNPKAILAFNGHDIYLYQKKRFILPYFAAVSD